MADPGDMQAVTISVPASIANLGPGLDTLALAVSLHLRLRVLPADGTNTLTFHFANMELQGENLIERAFRTLAAGRDFPSVAVEVETEIPMRSGLGSSAAAVAAGFRLFETVFGPQPMDSLLAAGCQLEGHPENVAAALLGGLVVCCQKDDGSVIALSGAWPPALRIIVATPEVQLETRRSRAVLPPTVPLASAVRNLQRAAVLVEALRARNYPAVSEGLRDCLHQPNRCAIVPALEQLLAVRHPDLVGVCLSGSGPSVAAFALRNPKQIAGLMAAAFRQVGVKCETRILQAYRTQPTR